jgi:2-keto-myo-inositol isomerase
LKLKRFETAFRACILGPVSLTIFGMSKSEKISRRRALGSSGLIVTAALAGSKIMASESAAVSAQDRTHGGAKAGAPFVFCLNTSTLRGQKLGIVKEIEVAAQAGFQAIEPWVGSIEDYVKGGGSLKDLKRKIADLGLTVESAIGFPEWIVDDEARRAKGLEQAKREMDLVAQIGGKRLAAPPAGATNEPGLDLAKAAERYRALLEAGDAIGVTPELELWGFSKNLHRLSECAFVAIESGHPKACILTDVFHLYKGGSDFRSIRLLSAQAIQLVHLNDFPAEPPREKIDDSYRVFPGDGVAPLTQFLQDLRSTGNGKVLSLELFNRKLWERDALEVAKEGLAKMKAVVKTAVG